MARILVVDDSPTIRKVVTAILSRHGYDAIGVGDGQLALDTLADAERTFDLVLVDFVMPKMNGFQFCRALRESKEQHAKIPIVLMSARSDKIRDQFVEQTGAIDAISKPFDAQALVVAIENALRRVSQGRVSTARLSLADDAEVSSQSGSSPSLDEAQLRARAVAKVGAKIGEALAPVLGRMKADSFTNEGVATALAAEMTQETLRDVVGAVRGVDMGEGVLVLSGDIANIPIGAVLQMLQVESKTGVVDVSNGKSNVTITMRSGLIDLVQSRGAGDEFRLGRFFVEEGLVTPEDIDKLLQRTRSGEMRAVQPTQPDTEAPPKSVEGADQFSTIPPAILPAISVSSSGEVMPKRALLGDVLVASGQVTKDQLKGALSRQSSELIYEILRWPRGWFEFRAQQAPPLARQAELGLPVASVVMEGFRRVDEWRLVESGLGSFESVLVRDSVAIDALKQSDNGGENGGLSRPEQVMLGVIDGERTVREIIAASHMSSFDACRILMQFLEARLVRRRHG